MLEYLFGRKSDGDARDLSNITRHLTKKNISSNRLVQMEQIHGVEVVVNPEEDLVKGADGIITNMGGAVLISRTADCAPIIFADVVKKQIGLSHQGWKGLLKELPIKMIQKMKELGSDPKNIGVFIGPCADVCCYEVGRETARLFPNSAVVVKYGKPYLDMKKLAFSQLESAGVPHENIIASPDCTIHQDEFFSYRKSENKEDFPRNFSFVVLQS